MSAPTALDLRLSEPRKAAEIWVLPALTALAGGDWNVHLRVACDGWSSDEVALHVATEAVKEIARQAVDGGELELQRDSELAPRGAPERKYRLAFTKAEQERFERVAAAHGLELSELVAQAMALAMRAHRGELHDANGRAVVLRRA